MAQYCFHRSLYNTQEQLSPPFNSSGKSQELRFTWISDLMALKFRQRVAQTGRQTFVVAALSLALVSFLCLLLPLASGLRKSKGKLDGSSFAVIDCSQVVVNTDKHTFRGLPDNFDYARHKDFYAFYLWNYCSGQTRNGTHLVDFCSENQHPLYDLFEFWKLWGASVHIEGTRFYWLEHGPRLLYIPYLVAEALTGLGILAGMPSLRSGTINRATLILASMAAISVLTAAAVAQITYGRLIARAGDEDIQITARRVGQTLYIANWAASVSTVLALALWCRLVATQEVRRAPTLDTASCASPQAVAHTSISAQALVESPVRTFVRRRNVAS